MGVYIPSMEMPECCADCFAISDSLGWCKASGNDIYSPFSMDGRPSFCPLVQLPEKHGRLKDSDSISADIRDMFCQGCLCSPISFNCQLCEITKVLCIVDSAPTIVEAEGDI